MWSGQNPVQARSPSQTEGHKPEEEKIALGRMLFFDVSLSKNRTQSCATCHDPGRAFTDGRSNAGKGMVSLGDDGISYGNRNTPTAMYAKFSPDFHFNQKTGQYVGGQFLDGRAKDLAEQSGQPPLNPVEMNMPSVGSIIERLKQNEHYYKTFRALYGDAVWNSDETAYKAMMQSLAAFERTGQFAPFNSKYDKYLRGEYELTVLEDLGRTLFFSNQNVNCSVCHKLHAEDAPKETFTNYEYHNIGVPRNEDLVALNQLAREFADHGLLENPQVDDLAQKGKFKVPTLRNIAVTGPYMHNGVFKDLRTVVFFYDKYNNPKRQINPETGQPWGEAEVPETVNLADLRTNALTDRKVDALVAFMELLTDEEYEHLLEKSRQRINRHGG